MNANSRYWDQPFLNGEKIIGAKFKFNDSVSITEGRCAGRHGTAINIRKLEPEPLYTIELDFVQGEQENGDIAVLESHLSLIT